MKFRVLHDRQQRSTANALLTLGFAAIIMFIAIALVLLRLGVPVFYIYWGLFGVTCLGFLFTAIFSTTLHPARFFIAKRDISPTNNAFAIAGSLLSATLLVNIYVLHLQQTSMSLALLAGISLGLMFNAFFIAPSLHRAGGYTLGGFFQLRFNAPFLTGFSALIVALCLFLFVTAQLIILGFIGAIFLHLNFDTMILGCVLLLMAIAWAGGFLAITRVQAIAFLGTVTALITAIISSLTAMQSGDLINPAQNITTAAHSSPLGAPTALLNDIQILSGTGVTSLACFGFIAFAGTAAMPYVLTFASAAFTRRGAFKAYMFGALFFLIPIISLPLLQNFDAIEQNSINTNMLENQEQLAALHLDYHMASNPDLKKSSVFIALSQLHGGNQNTTTSLSVLALVLAIICGTLASLLATAHVISTSIALDFFGAFFSRKLTAGKRMFFSRLANSALLVAALYWTTSQSSPPIIQVFWVLGLVASALFFPLCFAVLWKQTSSSGVIAGMALGFGSTIGVYFYIVYEISVQKIETLEKFTPFLKPLETMGISLAPIIGMAVSFVATYVISIAAGYPKAKNLEAFARLKKRDDAPILNRDDYF